MNLLQRTWRCVIRKPVKSLLLLLIILTVSLFWLSASASQNASISMQDATRQAVGAGLRLDRNEADSSRRITEISNKIGNAEGALDGVQQKKIETAYGTQWIITSDNSFYSLQLSDIEKLARVDGISDYNITTCITVVKPVNFNRIEDADTDQSADAGGVSLLGNLKMSLDSNVLSGNVTIKEGRMITEADSNVCVISTELATQNALALGDVLQFCDYRNPDNAAVYGAEIIGIYQTAQAMSPLMSGDTYRSENVIFTDLYFPEKAEGSAGKACFEHAYFQIADVDRYDEVKSAVRQVDIDWTRYDLIDRNGSLTAMAANFNDLEEISTLLIGLSAISGFVILFLIFSFWVKNRSREIGILLSLGIKKGNILGQLFLEALIIATLAFCLSLAAAPQVADAAARYLVTSQSEQAKLQELKDAGKVATEQEASTQTVTDVEVCVTGKMLAVCGAGIILLVSVSVGAAGILVLRKKPNAILSEIS